MELFEGDISTRGSLYDKPQKQATTKAARATFSAKYLPELLVNVYMQLLFDGEKCVLLFDLILVILLKKAAYADIIQGE